MWQLAAEQPSGVFLFITHGLFQDRMIKSLQFYPDDPPLSLPCGDRYYCTTYNCGLSLLDFQVNDEYCPVEPLPRDFVFDIRREPEVAPVAARVLGTIFSNWPLLTPDKITGQRIGPPGRRVDTDAW